MNNKMDIEDFIPLYPDIKDKDFIKKITHLKEFSSLKLSSEHTNVKKDIKVSRVSGKQPQNQIKKENRKDQEELLYQDQIFFKRFFSQNTPYREALVFKGVGSGKTCGASAIVENFVYSTLNDIKNEPAIIILKGDNEVSDFKNKVSNICTTEYLIAEKESSGKELSDRAKVLRFNKLIHTSYNIQKWGTFLKKLDDMTPNQIRESFSNRVIIVDESHHFREKLLDEDKDESPKIYERLLKLFTNVDNCIKIIMSGTPMTDDCIEIAYQLNLILPPEERFNTTTFVKDYFDANMNFKPEKEEEFLKRIAGRVSFLREPPLTKTFVGETINPWTTYLKLYKVITSQQQFDFINNYWGNDDMVLQKTLRSSVGVGKLENLEQLRNNPNELENYLKTYAAKILETIKLIERARQLNRCVYVYTDYVSPLSKEEEVTGSIDYLSAVLSLYGYKEIKDAANMTPGTNNFFRIDDKSNISAKKLESILKKQNSKENKYGQLNRVIIAGPKGKIALSLLNVREIIVLNPPWHMANLTQAIARGVRQDSFINFDKEAEKTINVYLLTAIPENFVNDDLNKKISPDLHVYNIVEEKEKGISQITRLLKKGAFDCGVNYDRNYNPKDIDGTKECEYQKCEYKCYGDYIPDNFNKEDEITGPYNYLYSGTVKTKLKERIIALFNREFNKHLDEIKTLIAFESLNVDEEVLLFALYELIANKVVIRNRYGFPSFLRESGNIYYLSYEGSTYIDYMAGKYPVLNVQIPIDDLIDTFESTFDYDKYLPYFISTPTKESFELLSFKTQIDMIETTFVHSQIESQTNYEVIKNRCPAIKYIDSLFKDVIFSGIIEDTRKKAVITGKREIIYHRLYYKEKLLFMVADQGKLDAKEQKGDLTRYYSGGNWFYLPHHDEILLVNTVVNVNKKQISKPTGYSGFIDDKGNFKIVTPGGKTTGAVCSTMKIDTLIQHIQNIDSYKKNEDPNINNMNNQQILINNILNTKYGNYFNKNYLETSDVRKLQNILYMLSHFSTKVSLCKYLGTILIDGDIDNNQQLFSNEIEIIDD